MCPPMTDSHEDGRLARATLEMETDGRTPGGAVITTAGHRFVFSGWAELAAAIEDWRATERPRSESARFGRDPGPRPEISVMATDAKHSASANRRRS